jgi:hypothetical protein
MLRAVAFLSTFNVAQRHLFSFVVHQSTTFLSLQINQPPGSAFSRFGPVQRTSITNVLVSML